MRRQAPRGTQDVLPAQAHLWRHLEGAFEKTMSLFGYGEIRTPTFEEYELFARTSGETSDIVSKEMYDFMDKGGRHVALRPEGTAPVMRAYIEHSLGEAGLPLRLWYCAPMFRYGRPQKGRLREHHQVGLELIGSSSPYAEAEVAQAVVAFYTALGIEGLEVRLNCIGRQESRARYGEALLRHLSGWLAHQEPEAQASAEKNPMRLWDSKSPEVQEALRGAPRLSDYLEPESADHFEAVCGALDEAEVEYVLDPGIVRGLDYYTDTVFEVQSSALGAQSSLCGGGRYDGLIGALGGKDAPSVGVGMGLERALLAMEEAGSKPVPDELEYYLIAASAEAWPRVRRAARQLRAAGVSCQFDLEERPLKSQFKAANRARAAFAAIWGSDELASGTVTVKDLKSGVQAVRPESELFS
ncbi:MAG: histidine--tRNA ligase [Fimbriimonadaceae bacterium]|nr:histidine--tRNA ligase [Fimbriimonadaceae bacterium]